MLFKSRFLVYKNTLEENFFNPHLRLEIIYLESLNNTYIANVGRHSCRKILSDYWKRFNPLLTSSVDVASLDGI